MITLVELFEQTSNNFIQHIHLDAFCRHHGIPFSSPKLSKYYRTYPNLAKAGYGSSPLYMHLRRKLTFRSVVRFDEAGRQDDYNRLLLQGGDIFCKGWNFRSPDEIISRYLPVYQELFRPGFDTSGLDQHFLQRPNGEVLIGVHIRRGDYKTWFGGIFYYDDAVYIDKVRQLVSQLDRPAKILLFTNDPALDLFVYRKAFKNVLLSGHSVAADHYLMSKCDYILGPYSTFSMWASFIGETRMLHIRNEDHMINPGDFHICRGN